MHTPSPSKPISPIIQPAGEEKDQLDVELMLLETSTEATTTSSSQPAGDLFSQNELTFLREENDRLEAELMTLQASIEVRRVKLLEGEVKKLRVKLGGMNENDRLEAEMMTLLATIELKLLEGEVKKLRVVLGGMNEKVNRLKDLVDQEGKVIAEWGRT